METDSDSSSSDSESDTSTLGRIAEQVKNVRVAALGKADTDRMVTVKVRPRKGGHKTKVRWTADSGVRKTLLSQEDWERIKKKNSAVKLRRNKIKFVPYGTKISLPILGKAKVRSRITRMTPVNSFSIICIVEYATEVSATAAAAIPNMPALPIPQTPSW